MSELPAPHTWKAPTLTPEVVAAIGEGVSTFVNAVISAVEPVIRADEQEDADRRVDRQILRNAQRWADLRAEVEALRDIDPHYQPVRDAYDAVLALIDGGGSDE